MKLSPGAATPRSAGSREPMRQATYMDDDLLGLSREQLIAAVQRLRVAIRAHRDSPLPGKHILLHRPAGAVPRLRWRGRRP